MAVMIHPIHRQLATIAALNMDRKGNLVLGMPEIKLIMGLMRRNLDLVLEVEGLKELAFQAHLIGDMEWEQDLCQRLEEIEMTTI